jgi:hypothetical protein
MTVKKEIPFKKWTFVDKQDLDTDHWYIRLDGGLYHNVIFRFMKVSLNMDAKSIDFDYEVVDYPSMDDPHGEPAFTEMAGDILKSILDDAMDKQDYIIGPKNE